MAVALSKCQLEAVGGAYKIYNTEMEISISSMKRLQLLSKTLIVDPKGAPVANENICETSCIVPSRDRRSKRTPELKVDAIETSVSRYPG